MRDGAIDPNEVVASKGVNFSCLHHEPQLAQHHRIVHSESILRQNGVTLPFDPILLNRIDPFPNFVSVPVFCDIL